MDLSFLETQFIRMQKIGAYAVIFRNSINKGSWKKYRITETYEQDNLIFSVLLYIMEQSSREEICTIDDITDFLKAIDDTYLEKGLTYDSAKELANFIIDNIFYDQGKAMYFKSYDFKSSAYKDINIAFVKSRMEEIDGIRRVSYHLTEQGYDLLLSTLEIEENLKITIQEIIFKEHLKKASYDKAVGDIKNIFDIYRRKVLGMEDAILSIKENPLSYSTDDYKKVITGNLEFFEEVKRKFSLHKENVEKRISEFIEHDINTENLNNKELDALVNLKVIKRYLSKVIDEDQKVLIKHFDLKEVYTQELENIAKMSVIERFDLKRAVYDKVLANLELIDNIDIFLRPLLNSKMDKTYNVNKALEYQKNIDTKQQESNVIINDDCDEEFAEKMKLFKLERIITYKNSIKLLLELTMKNGSITLDEINSLLKNSPRLLNILIPSIEIFREIIIEFLKLGHIDIKLIKDESKQIIDNGEIEFRLTETILELLAENKDLEDIVYIEVDKVKNTNDVILENLNSDTGNCKKCICSNVIFRIRKGGANNLWAIH